LACTLGSDSGQRVSSWCPEDCQAVHRSPFGSKSWRWVRSWGHQRRGLNTMRGALETCVPDCDLHW
jgi:hypothetical protein